MGPPPALGLTTVVAIAHLGGRAARATSRSMLQQLCSRTRTNHHAPALLRSCYGLLREVSWWAPWRGFLDGMQGVRGSDPTVPHDRTQL
jgi:hypothetical protein